jgi:aryl-alcohol dehydrogenase-like predicted oxidoreductase
VAIWLLSFAILKLQQIRLYIYDLKVKISVKKYGCEKMFKVPKVKLGSTGLEVSKLGIGPPTNLSPEEGGRLLTGSYELGVNFWDTSDDYGTHPHIASALKYVPRKQVVISTKTYAKSGDEASESLKSSLKEFGTDYLDIFLLHFVKFDWVDSCHQVLKEMKDLKTTGIVKAIGLSTHSVAVARKAAQFEELDVIMAICCKADQTLINKFNELIPLEDGSMLEMFHALKLAHDNGKGVVAMKVLGGETPQLIEKYQEVIKGVAQLDFVDAMVIGMRSLDEVKKNVMVIAPS